MSSSLISPAFWIQNRPLFVENCPPIWPHFESRPPRRRYFLQFSCMPSFSQRWNFACTLHTHCHNPDRRGDHLDRSTFLIPRLLVPQDLCDPRRSTIWSSSLHHLAHALLRAILLSLFRPSRSLPTSLLPSVAPESFVPSNSSSVSSTGCLYDSPIFAQTSISTSLLAASSIPALHRPDDCAIPDVATRRT